MNTFYKTSDSFKQGSFTLPQKYYIEKNIFSLETDKIFYKKWLCCGRSEELNNCGDYKIVRVGNESIIIARDNNNSLQAFYNICRHRGTQLCSTTKGSFTNKIKCPYHGWSYNLQGNLRGAPNMDKVTEFNRNDYSLHTISIIDWEGFIFINLSENSKNFISENKSILLFFNDWELNKLKIIKNKKYLIDCNWKLIIQNYSECYHCPIIHPELAKVTPYTGGKNNFIKGKFLGGYMELNADSVTHDGKYSGPIIGKLKKENLQRVYYYSFFPNLLISLHPDYVMIHIINPINCSRSQVDCYWLFSKEVIENKKYNPNSAIKFWDKINKEDWKVCEQSQIGIKSRKYKPGPYSAQESLLAAYDEYYLDIINQD